MDHRRMNRQLKTWRLWTAMAVALVAPAAAAQGVIKGDPAKAQQIVTQVCAACHAADGNSAIPANPSLSGQHPEYTYKQLRNFKSQGGKPAERNNGVMAGMVANLSEDDMKNLAAYFAVQKAKPRVARDAALASMALGDPTISSLSGVLAVLHGANKRRETRTMARLSGFPFFCGRSWVSFLLLSAF